MQDAGGISLGGGPYLDVVTLGPGMVLHSGLPTDPSSGTAIENSAKLQSPQRQTKDADDCQQAASVRARPERAHLSSSVRSDDDDQVATRPESRSATLSGNMALLTLVWVG